MRKLGIIVLFVALAAACENKTSSNTQTESQTVTEKTSKQTPFPDFGYMVPDYKGEVFVLSQNYPDTLPKQELPPFFQTDYKKDWRKYLLEVQKYCFEGNTEVDFRVLQNKVRHWYHMPWQHYGPQAREGFHGLTQEAPVKALQLAPTQTDTNTGAVAVGFYNDVAALTIQEVWKDHYHPNHSHNMSFKNGSVLFKILFVTLPEDIAVKQVPWLVNGLWWDAFVCPDFHDAEDTDQMRYRRQIKVALVQMDIMVRDDRAPNGWIFGNFQYNGKMNKADKWENLVPVGLMWGEDPNDTTNFSNAKPTRTIINPKLVETIINPDSNELPATHLGWNSRLNGPVDNPMSSCYSCHSTSEYPANLPMSPLFNDSLSAACPPGSAGWMYWFRNLKCGEPFTPKSHSMDFSLQLSQSIQFFYNWKKSQGGLYSNDYAPAPPAAPAAAGQQARMAKAMLKSTPAHHRATLKPDTTGGQVDYPIGFPASK
jgi:hypothetical protein